MKVGDRVKLPPSLSEPGGEYRIVAMNADTVRLRSKHGVERRVAKDQLPILLARATPIATTPVSSESFSRDHGVLSQEGYHVGAIANLPPVNRQIVLRR